MRVVAESRYHTNNCIRKNYFLLVWCDQGHTTGLEFQFWKSEWESSFSCMIFIRIFYLVHVDQCHTEKVRLWYRILKLDSKFHAISLIQMEQFLYHTKSYLFHVDLWLHTGMQFYFLTTLPSFSCRSPLLILWHICPGTQHALTRLYPIATFSFCFTIKYRFFVILFCPTVAITFFFFPSISTNYETSFDYRTSGRKHVWRQMCNASSLCENYLYNRIFCVHRLSEGIIWSSFRTQSCFQTFF